MVPPGRSLQLVRMFPRAGSPQLDAVLPVWLTSVKGDNHFPPSPGYAPVNIAQRVEAQRMLASFAVQAHIPHEDQKPHTL